MNMTIDHFTSRFLSLLLALWLVGYCHGQENSQPGRVESPQSVTSTGQPKLLITQGSDKHDNVHAMLQDKTGDLWFASTGAGVYRYDGTSFTQDTQRDGLRSNTVYAILDDTRGNIWFGTNRGLSRYDGKTLSAFPSQWTMTQIFLHFSTLKPLTMTIMHAAGQSRCDLVRIRASRCGRFMSLRRERHHHL